MTPGVAIVVALFVAIASCSSAGDDDPSSSGDEAPDESTTKYVLSDLAFNIAPDVARVAAIGDGVVLASYGVGGGSGVYVIRLDAAGEVSWAKNFPELGVPRDLFVSTDSVWLVGYSSPETHLVELSSSDGSLVQAGVFSAVSARAVLAPDGGLVVAGRNLVAKLGDDLTVEWAKNVDGQDAIVVGDHIFVGNGVGLTRMTLAGQVDYRSIPDFEGAGNPEISGLRELPDGRIMVAAGIDAPVSPPLFVGVYDVDGSLQWFKGYTPSVDGVATQFGEGVSMAMRGSSTFVGYVATSGVLGSDVRASVVSRIEADGSSTRAWNAGTAVTVDDSGIPWSVNNTSVFRALETEACDLSSLELAVEDVEATVTRLEGQNAAAADTTLEIATMNVTTIEVQTSAIVECP